MPYAGRRSGQSFAAFAEGARLGMAQKQQAENANLQQQQLELARQQQAGIDEYYKAQTELTRKKFEAGQAADAQANASEQGMAAAEFGATSNSLHRMVKQDPRLKGLADMAAATAAQMRAQGADDKALLVHAAKSMQDINAERDRLARTDWSSGWRDRLHSGAFAKDTLTRETDEALSQNADGILQAVESGQMDVAQGEEILTKLRIEQSKRAAASIAMSEGAQRVANVFGTLFPPGTQESAVGRFLEQEVARGGMSPEDALSQGLKLMSKGSGSQEPKDQREAFVSKFYQSAEAAAMTPEERKAYVKEWEDASGYGRQAGQPQAQGGGAPQVQGLGQMETQIVQMGTALLSSGLSPEEAKKAVQAAFPDYKEGAKQDPVDAKAEGLRKSLEAAGVPKDRIDKAIQAVVPEYRGGLRSPTSTKFRGPQMTDEERKAATEQFDKFKRGLKGPQARPLPDMKR